MIVYAYKLVFAIAIAIALAADSSILATLGLAIDSSKPTIGGKVAPPPSSGTKPPGGGTSSPPPGGSSGSPPQLFFADVVGRTMPLLYCRVGEPCAVAAQFANVGAALAANQPIPDPLWTINGQPAAPMSIQRLSSGSGWPTQDVKQWTAQFNIPLGNYQVRAIMPQVPTEKEASNNVAIGPVTVGQADMAVKLDRDNVDYNTRYEIKAEIENKGTVPTRALSMLAVLVVNVTHMSTPPTPNQCIGNPNLSGCVVERHTVESLAPGQKKRWQIGGKQLATTSVRALAQVACRDPGPCADQNAGNNSDSKTFGP